MIFLQGRDEGARTTVYKRKDLAYNLKMKASKRKYLEGYFSRLPYF